MQERKPDKVEAIYSLREAAEKKARAEVALEAENTVETRAELLDAALELESKTVDAVEVCHACDRKHTSDQPHERRTRIGEHAGNVVEVSFHDR